MIQRATALAALGLALAAGLAGVAVTTFLFALLMTGLIDFHMGLRFDGALRAGTWLVSNATGGLLAVLVHGEVLPRHRRLRSETLLPSGDTHAGAAASAARLPWWDALLLAGTTTGLAIRVLHALDSEQRGPAPGTIAWTAGLSLCGCLAGAACARPAWSRRQASRA